MRESSKKLSAVIRNYDDVFLGEARKGRHSLAHGESRGERWRPYRTEPRQGRHSLKRTAYVAPVGLLNRRPLVPSALALG